jgi:DnaJ-class molecular chaperone
MPTNPTSSRREPAKGARQTADKELPHQTAQQQTPTPPGQPRAGDDAPPGTPGTGEDVCPTCGGTGRIGLVPCSDCEGTGRVVKAIGGA